MGCESPSIDTIFLRNLPVDLPQKLASICAFGFLEKSNRSLPYIEVVSLAVLTEAAMCWQRIGNVLGLIESVDASHTIHGDCFNSAACWDLCSHAGCWKD